MNKTEIKKQIVESLLEDKELISSLIEIIQNDAELQEYYNDMKLLLLERVEETIDPGGDYFDSTFNKIIERVEQKPTIIPLFNQQWLKIAAAILLVLSSYYLGTFQQTNQSNNDLIVQTDSFQKEPKKLSKLFNKYTVTLTSFVNMDEFESHDLLKAIIMSSNELLDDTRELKIEYKSNEDVYDILTGLERILIAISQMKDKSFSSVRMMQFQLQNEIKIDNKLSTQI